ncbi:MAG: AAA family ATPase, partial [Bacteroidota bacterium]
MADNLPLGMQDFRSVIEGGYKYIDKTMYLHRMATTGKYYFLSRPRRFGKSLTVSTLNELYKGSRELFRGLWIEDKWDWSRKHPVIRLSFKDINFEQRGLEEPLSERITEIGSNHQIQLVAKSARERMRELIIALSGPRKVVVLIDEYDAPIVHYLGVNIEKSVENREFLKEFYSVLKEMDQHLELVFLTGVSKFSKTGIFSGLNNLTDLTMDASFATMLGYTQEELTSCFSEKIDEAAQIMELSRDELLEEMRIWYNGYRFHHRAEKVYNPLSVNMFLYRKEFANFWFATGTPTFLINLLRKEGIYELHFPPLNPAGFETFELDRLKVEAILFQTG